VREAERKRIEFLFNTSASISLIKLRTLKDEAVIHEKKIKLTGITGHSLETMERRTYTFKTMEKSSIRYTSLKTMRH